MQHFSQIVPRVCSTSVLFIIVANCFMISVLFYNSFDKVHLETVIVIITLITSNDERNNYD